MAHRNLQKYPSNAAEFLQKFPNNEENTVHSISDPAASASGSRWNMTHLEAYRVILSLPEQSNEHLKVLQPYRDRARLHIEDSPILKGLTAVSHEKLTILSSTRLREMGGEFGAFYTRLADVVRIPEPVQPMRPKRDVRKPDNPDFVTGDGLGLSSPLTSETSSQIQSSPFRPSETDAREQADHMLPTSSQIQSSPFRPSETGDDEQADHMLPTSSQIQSSPFRPSETGDDEQDDHMLRTKHETVTASMAAEFISTILDICCDQPNPESRIEFSPAPTTHTLDIFSIKAISQDDGCLIRRHTSPHNGCWVPHGYNLAILECKAQYTSWNEDGDTAQVSTNVLAQHVCEMLGLASQRARSAYNVKDLSQKNSQIFLLSVHQSTITFMHWTITSDYLEYLVLHYPGQILPFFRLCSSSAFDLEKPDERLEAAYGIMSLVYFLDDEEESIA